MKGFGISQNKSQWLEVTGYEELMTFQAMSCCAYMNMVISSCDPNEVGTTVNPFFG